MFTILRAFFVSVMLMFSYNASADFFGGSDCPPWEYDCNDWPEWTPMYWMEEMSDEFDDNNDDWYRYGGGPYGGPYGGPRPYGPPMMPYGGAPYGGPAPMPYGAPAPMPYGGPAPMPYGRPAPAPYGRPPMPYGAPQQAPSAPAQK
jgi:hypothetical protein